MFSATEFETKHPTATDVIDKPFAFFEHYGVSQKGQDTKTDTTDVKNKKSKFAEILIDIFGINHLSNPVINEKHYCALGDASNLGKNIDQFAENYSANIPSSEISSNCISRQVSVFCW